MKVDLVMPQMGESIAEGTITRWIKNVGESVERDDPVFEISTDKVDAEIPATVAGVLVEIRAQEGETVAVDSVVAILETDASAAETAPAAAKATPAPAPAATSAPAPSPPSPPRTAPAAEAARFVSPVVRRIAAEHGIDPAVLPGTGAGGRVTKKDIEAFLASGGAAPTPTASRAPATPSKPAAPSFSPGERVVREPMTVMRRKIAEHMIESRRVSAHVHSVFEIDLTHIVRLRNRHKAAYVERHGTRLSFMAFFIKAICDGLREWPILNSSVEGDHVVYRKDLNVGVAVALENGLIVPVIRNADELSIAGLSKRIEDLALRARTKKLNPDEVQGGTFTITNPGQFGGVFGLPIINQPQVAILGVGGIHKRPVVIDDAIAIRSIVVLAMSYDHRVVDGAVADQFLARVKRGLEQFDESLL